MMGQILYYALHLAPKGISIVDAHGMTWGLGSRQLLGPVPDFNTPDDDLSG